MVLILRLWRAGFMKESYSARSLKYPCLLNSGTVVVRLVNQCYSSSQSNLHIYTFFKAMESIHDMEE